MKETSLSSYWNYNNNTLHHFFKDEFLALQNLHENKNIVIKKSVNFVIIVVKIDYLDKMENHLMITRNLKNCT